MQCFLLLMALAIIASTVSAAEIPAVDAVDVDAIGNIRSIRADSASSIVQMSVVHNPEMEHNKTLGIEFFEGDEVLTEEQKKALEAATLPDGQDDNNLERNGLIDFKYRWPKNILPYTIDGAYTSKQRTKIEQAINRLNNKLGGCVKLKHRRNEVNYVEIRNNGRGTGCYSGVGKTGGKQIVNLESPGCLQLWNSDYGIIHHELLHALGLYHEQSRSDRDKYVTIHEKNIKEKRKGDFKHYKASEVSHFRLPYDYYSVMHYSYKSDTKNEKVTIEPKDKSVPVTGGGKRVLGQRVEADDIDIKKIKTMYGCSTTGCQTSRWKGDSSCDDGNNNLYCGFDGGDCCGANVNKKYCKKCECLDPAFKCCKKIYVGHSTGHRRLDKPEIYGSYRIQNGFIHNKPWYRKETGKGGRDRVISHDTNGNWGIKSYDERSRNVADVANYDDSYCVNHARQNGWKWYTGGEWVNAGGRLVAWCN